MTRVLVRRKVDKVAYGHAWKKTKNRKVRGMIEDISENWELAQRQNSRKFGSVFAGIKATRWQ